MANYYSIQDSNGHEITGERQIYAARITAQRIADFAGREVSFASEHGGSNGRETFKPQGKQTAFGHDLNSYMPQRFECRNTFATDLSPVSPNWETTTEASLTEPSDNEREFNAHMREQAANGDSYAIEYFENR